MQMPFCFSCNFFIFYVIFVAVEFWPVAGIYWCTVIFETNENKDFTTTTTSLLLLFLQAMIDDRPRLSKISLKFCFHQIYCSV